MKKKSKKMTPSEFKAAFPDRFPEWYHKFIDLRLYKVKTKS